MEAAAATADQDEQDAAYATYCTELLDSGFRWEDGDADGTVVSAEFFEGACVSTSASASPAQTPTQVPYPRATTQGRRQKAAVRQEDRLKQALLPRGTFANACVRWSVDPTAVKDIDACATGKDEFDAALRQLEAAERQLSHGLDELVSPVGG